MELQSFNVMGVNGWVLLQIAVGVLVAASWSFLRRNKNVKGGQPKHSVNFDAALESPEAAE